MLIEMLTSGAVLVVTLYLYLTWNYSHWRKKGITQLEPVLPGIGNLLDVVLLKKSLGTMHTEIYRKFPGHAVVGFYQLRQPALLVRDPEVVRNVLVTSFSKFRDNFLKISAELEPLTTKNPFLVERTKWKETRAGLAPAFTANRVKHFFPKMQDLCKKLVQYLEKHVNEDIEARNLGHLFTTDTIATCGFGIDSNAVSGEESMFLKCGREIVSELESGFTMFILFFMPFLSKYLNLRLLPTKACGFVEEVVDTVTDYRKRNNITENDYLQLLLKNREKALLEAKPDDKSVEEESQRVLLGHAVTFFMESFEASSIVISFIMYELSVNSEIQGQLYKELDRSLHDNEQLDYDTLVRLPCLDKVVSETLRKYPPVPSMMKVCIESTVLEIDGKSINIEAGTTVVIPITALHNDPKYFPQPHKFDPERFSEENITQRHHYCYLPFNEGPRICIGMRFAVAQVKLFVANIVMNYNIMKSEKTADKLSLNPQSLLSVSKEGIWIRLEKRK